jgi:hypothetical protein
VWTTTTSSWGLTAWQALAEISCGSEMAAPQTIRPKGPLPQTPIPIHGYPLTQLGKREPPNGWPFLQ